MQATAGDLRLRVLVVDDHEMFRTGLRALLEEEGMDVADSASADAALRRLASFRPAVVVMDMNMPGMSGVEAIPLVHEVVPDAAVLMLTISDEDESVLHAVQNGAAGYLLKDAELGEIVGAIHSVAAGFGAVAPGVTGILLDSVRNATASPVACAPAPQAPLSPREREVLALVSEGFGNGDIARRLFMSPSTVKHHVSRVLDKLGVENRVQAATFAVRTGFYDG